MLMPCSRHSSGGWHSSLGLFEDGHDLAIGEAGGFHRISFKSNNLEILLLTQVKGWGYYQGVGVLPESLTPINRWGGNFKGFVDVPHFERGVLPL
jgi:hypothetical protein